MARRKKNHDEQPKGTVPGNWYVKMLDVFPSNVFLCFGDREAMCRTAYDAFIDDSKGYCFSAGLAEAYASELREHFGKSLGEIDGECLSVTDGNGYETNNAYRIRRGDSAGDNTAAVTLQVDNAQALILAKAQASGHFHLALVHRGDKANGYLAQQDIILSRIAEAAIDAGTVEPVIGGEE